MDTPRARFSVGQVIHHKLFDYRGVVIDVDAVFSGTEDWYERVARTRPAKDQPWYQVLVDGATHTTYVAEQNLEDDASGLEVDHPLIRQYFDHFRAGVYHRRQPSN